MPGWMLPAMVALLFVGTAGADTPEERANKLYNQGKELMLRGELLKAVASFDAAWKTYRHPLILKKRAEVRERLVQYEEAIADYRLYLTRLKARKRKERRVVRERIRALEALLERPVVVRVVSSRPGVLVAVDKGVSKRTPFDLLLTAGKHHVELRDHRYLAIQRVFRVQPGKRQVVRIDAVAKTGQLTIATDRSSFAGTNLALDQTPIVLDASERAGARLAPRVVVIGKHSLVCSVKGLPNFYLEFEVQEKSVTIVTCQFQQLVGTNMARDPWGWLTMVGAVGGLAAGTGLLISWAADVEKAREQDLELITDKHIWGGVALGLGVALGIGSYFVFTRDRGGHAVAPPAFVPVLAVVPRGGVAAAVWRF